MTPSLPRAMIRALALVAFFVFSFAVIRGARAVVVRTAVAYRPVVHPVARTAAAVDAAVTAIAVGTVVRTLPPACTSVSVGNAAYQQCGSTWYRPAYAGSTVTYTVVNAPR